jgi:hypothetical protein
MMIPPASEALDLITLASRATDLFVAQAAAEQRKLLHLVLKEDPGGGRVADVAPGAISGIKPFELRK